MTLDLFAPKKHAPTLHHGDCLAVLRTLPDASVDAVVTDPPYLIDFMGKGWDSADGIAGKPEVWAECLRVLKPGGHLLAFGATRTYHRMTCAIEDAGFEIRDSIHWMYGSGFPKSLDVSKAMDKAGGTSPEQTAKWLRISREARGLSREQVALHIGCTEASVRDWEEGRARAKGAPLEFMVPSEAYRVKLEELFSYPTDGREIVGTGSDRREDGTVYAVGHSGVLRSGGNTDLAKQWQGWGTALKPAFEPVVVAAKPATIGSCLSQLSARVAAECSKSNPSAFVVAFASALRSVVPTFATRVDSSEATATSQYESDKSLSWNTVSSWQSTWAEVLAAENTFIIETETRPTTDLRTLLSCLSRITGANTFVRESEFSSLVQLAASLFLASTHRLNAIRTLAAIESATAKSLTSSPDADASGPHEPVVVARKPLAGTVAANVERYGTGALNIDASRVAAAKGDEPLKWAHGRGLGFHGAKDNGPCEALTSEGRWPPNIVLSHTEDCTESACDETCAVAELDRQSGERPGMPLTTKRKGVKNGAMFNPGPDDASQSPGYGDTGGASRFFPVFRYQAKASRSERGEGNVHPTVKPIALMEWLVTLVTPPGGVVLDPFMGSGTTGVAAVRKGFRFVGIEREDEYLAIARARIEAA